MGKINKVNKQTTNPYLNLYDLDVVNKVGREGHYYVASRAKTEDDLKLRKRMLLHSLQPASSPSVFSFVLPGT